MLTITNYQQAQLASSVESSFIKYSVSFFSEKHREQHYFLGNGQFEKIVSTGLAKARSYGVTRRKGVLRFINSQFLMGTSFDEDLRFPQIQKVLHSDLDGETKARRIQGLVETHIAKIFGADGELALDATSRILAMDYERLMVKDLPNLDRSTWDLWSSIYPALLETMTIETAKSVMVHVHSYCSGLGIWTPQNVRIVSIFAFLLGSQFQDDLRFPELPAILHNKSEGEDERVKTLYKHFRSRLEHAIEVFVHGKEV